MAFLLKDNKSSRAGRGSQPVLEQWIKVSRASATLPQSTSAALFNVIGGRVLLKALIGEVTVVLGAGTTPDLGIEVNPSGSGMTSDLAADVAVASDEVGTIYSVEGDGTAMIAVSSGFGVACNGNGAVIQPGAIQLAASESVTGEVKWDLYYMPLDEGAYVEAA